MKPKEPLTINLNVDWRVLVILGIIVSLMALAFSAARAKAGSPPDANSIQARKQASRPEPAATAIPVAPQLNCPDGLLATTNGECITADSVGVAPLSTAGDIGIAAIGGDVRHFYVSSASYFANAAPGACASRYHMASLWEILNVSNLTYDINQPGAKTQDDSGFGPPSGWNGWVRTGYGSDTSNTAGTGNCNNWSTTSGAAWGTNVKLSNSWETAPGHVSAWDATSFSCSSVGPVWCAK